MTFAIRKALVIDDDPGVLNFISELLEMENFKVWRAVDGEAGMQMIEVIGEFDLVVTDILMPNQNGIEVLMSLRSKRSAKTKVIAISGGGPHLSPSSFLADTKGLGADAILMKPFSPDEFRAALANLDLGVHAPDYRRAEELH